jgi:hypothetical protein
MILIPVAAAVSVVAWAFRTRKVVAVYVGGAVLATTGLALGAVTDEFGTLTWFLVYVLLSLSLVSGLVLLCGMGRLLMCVGATLREVLVVLGCVATGFVALGTLASFYSTQNGYMQWYFMQPTARLTVAGTGNGGYIHRLENSGGTHVIVTRRMPWRGDTYWIALPKNHRPTMKRCGDWTAPRFPVISIGDVNPPCLGFSFGDEPRARPEPPERNLMTGDRYIEFTADDGKRLRVEW